MILLNQIIALIGLIFGTITDFRTREVPDWVNYSLIGFGLGSSLIYSLIFQDWFVIIYSLIGFGLCFLLGLIMFYTGQWGGGDSKMIMGLGALLGFYWPIQESFLIKFLLNIIIVGGIYGIFYAFILILKNFKNFKTEFLKRLKLYRRKRIAMQVIVLVGIILLFVIPQELRFSLLILLVGVFLMFYIWIGVKIIEKVCMIKEVEPTKLTEGDWIEKDVFVGKKRIVGPKELGISKKQIETLQKAYKKKKFKVTIKEGIPFIPSFLLAYIVTYIWDWLAIFF